MRARSLRIVSALFFASIVMSPAGISAQPGAADSPATTPARNARKPALYESDPKFVAATAEGRKLSGTGELNFAIDAYKKANKIAGGKCAGCLRHIVELQMKTGSFKDAAASAAELATLADNTVDKSEAEWLQGQALYSQGGDKPKPAQLQAADQALKAAIADYPKNLSARFCDGAILARMGQLDAAREQFEACVAQASPSDPASIRAKHFAANPAMSYAKMAPAFTVTALDGTKFTLDEMGGRVVLIDFWATWCGPCNEELPHMKKIAKEFAGQPLVIISVSWDDDAAKWKAFIQKNEMTWIQYRDANRDLSNRFGVHEIPHYFTIDSDGVLTAEMMGSGSDVEGKLRKLVAKAKATQAATVSSTTPVTPTSAN
jgi:thiol-disulfide isomerase/thioredoxin/TolA-binding protein